MVWCTWAFLSHLYKYVLEQEINRQPNEVLKSSILVTEYGNSLSKHTAEIQQRIYQICQ